MEIICFKIYYVCFGLFGVLYTVRLLTHVHCKRTHFVFHSFKADMSYSLQTNFVSVMKDWADKYHVWGTPTSAVQSIRNSGNQESLCGNFFLWCNCEKWSKMLIAEQNMQLAAEFAISPFAEHGFSRSITVGSTEYILLYIPGNYDAIYGATLKFAATFDEFSKTHTITI